MNKLVAASAAAAALLLVVEHSDRIQRRLDRIDQQPRVEPVDVERLARALDRLQGELGLTRAAIASDDSVERLARELAGVTAELDQRECTLDEQDARLSAWEALWVARDPADIDHDLAALRAELERSAREVDRVEAESVELAARQREGIEQLGQRVEPLLARDTERMWRDLVGPVVQLAGDSTVGSGVLLESRPAEDGQGFTTHLLTAWHVVRDIYGSIDRTTMPVPVKVYDLDGSTRQESAQLIAYDVPLDVAVLVLDTREPIAFGARPAAREQLAAQRIFDPVYAVGCPLGNDPIPTVGEIASTHHVVDGGTYWMISAPTYIGNSGGGIFDARTHELVGIFSKIYTHGAARSTIVPHMGLATPLPLVYDWLEREGHAGLLLDAPDAQPQTASAQR